MTAFATTADVAAAWRPLAPDESTFAEFWLEQASEMIRDEFVTVDDRITAGSLSAVIVKGVAVAMVIRLMKNPDGMRSVQESIEDYSVTRTRDSALSAGELYMSESERRRLTRRGRQAFSISQTDELATCETWDRIAVHRAWRDR